MIDSKTGENLNERFGSLLGEPKIEEVSLIKFFRRISSFTRDKVNVKEQELVVGGQKRRCIVSEAIDVAGRSGTGTDGKVVLRLNDFVCGNFSYEEPISFVATPHSSSPVYLTTNVTVPDPPNDVFVEVFTWNQTGMPIPNIAFSWRCQAQIFFAPD